MGAGHRSVGDPKPTLPSLLIGILRITDAAGQAKPDGCRRFCMRFGEAVTVHRQIWPKEDTATGNRWSAEWKAATQTMF